MIERETPAGMPRRTAAFFLIAVLYLCVGVGMGLYMAATHDHTLSPVHAHTNLLGWVTTALMGLFHGQARQALSGRLVWLQLALHGLGTLSMMIGLIGLLTSRAALVPFLPPGIVLTIASLALFAWGVVRALAIGGAVRN